MKNKYIKELISIAAELDSRGLLKEASVLDKLAADIINFEERARALRPKLEPKSDTLDEEEQLGEVVNFEDKRDERRNNMIREFALKNLSPDAKFEHEGGERKLSEYAYHGSTTLIMYIIEVLPDRLADLYHDLGESDINQLIRDVVSEAEQAAEGEASDNPHYSEDFSFLVEAVKYYLIEEEHEVGI